MLIPADTESETALKYFPKYISYIYCFIERMGAVSEIWLDSQMSIFTGGSKL